MKAETRAPCCLAVPEPSSENSAWWDPLDIASLQQSVQEESERRSGESTNPFEGKYFYKDSNTASGQTSDTTKPGRAATIKRKPPPPHPSSKPATSPPSHVKPPVNPATKPRTDAAQDSASSARPPVNRNPSSKVSLMDQQDQEIQRPGLKVREATNEWQVITPSPMKR